VLSLQVVRLAQVAGALTAETAVDFVVVVAEHAGELRGDELAAATTRTL
jgi:hypothetical protein